MNAVVEMAPRPPGGALVQAAGRMAVAEVVQHAVVVQEVMRAVMKPTVHFGKIPGTPKPTLYQPGADVLCMTFRIAPEFETEDLSTPDMIRFRVTCRGVHQTTGTTLGAGIGEGSTNEEKYKWRKSICDEEFDETPAHMRRVKYAKAQGGGFYKQKQVRTEPADLANTVLKMAAKRAKIAMVLNVTAASDMFGQDLEDLDATLQQHLTADEEPQGQPEPTGPAVWPADSFAAQLARWTKAIENGLKSTDDILAMARSKGVLAPDQEAAIRAIKAPAADTTSAASGDTQQHQEQQ